MHMAIDVPRVDILESAKLLDGVLAPHNPELTLYGRAIYTQTNITMSNL